MSTSSSTKSESFNSDFDESEVCNENEKSVPPDEIKHVSQESLGRQSSRYRLNSLVKKWKRIMCPPRGRAAKYITWSKWYAGIVRLHDLFSATLVPFFFREKEFQEKSLQTLIKWTYFIKYKTNQRPKVALTFKGKFDSINF